MQKSLSQNAFYKAVLNIFNLVVPLLVNPYIMHVLDVELYGAYNRVYAEFTVFLTLGAFGIYNYGIREISRIRSDSDQVNQLFTSLFVIGVTANVLAGMVYIGYFAVAAKGIDFYIYALMLIQLAGNMLYIEFINEAVENYRFITIKTILIRIGYLISIFLFVRKPTDILPYTAVICITVFLNNFVSFVYLKRSLRFIWKHISVAKHFVPLVIAFVLTNVEILYGQLDKLMIGRFLGDVQVSYYVIPTTLIGMMSTVPLSLITVAIPRLSSLIGTADKERYTAVLEQTRDVYFAMLTPLCIGVTVLAPEIMQIYGGSHYEACWPILVIAAMVRLFGLSQQSIVMNLMMYINGLEKKMLWFLGIFGFVNLGLNLLLLWSDLFTVAAALMTTGLATILFSFFAFNYTKKKLHLPIKMISFSQFRYLLVSLLFIPIGWAVRRLPGGVMGHAVLTMIPCILLYGFALYLWQDDLFVMVLNKYKLERFFSKKK